MLSKSSPLLLVIAFFLLGADALGVAPPSPTLLQVGSTISSSAEKGFVCRWQDNSSDEDLFEIRLKAGPNGVFTPVNYLLANSQFGTWYASNRFLTGIPDGTIFQFQVIACHANIVRDQTTNQITDFTVTERSAPSNTLTLTYRVAATDLQLHAPTQLQATLVNDGFLQLSWKDGFVTGSGAAAVQTRSQVEDGFAFFVKEASAATYPTTEGFSIAFDIENFKLPTYNVLTAPETYGLVPGKSYVMRMRAVKGTDQVSDWSNEVAFTMPAMRAPTNLTLTPINERSMFMSWDDNSDNEHGYVIQIEIGAPFGDITWDSVGANTKTYILNNLIPGTKAKWKITGAFNPGGNQSYVVSASSNLVEAGTTMPAPTNLQGSTSYDPVAGTTITELSWQETANSESGLAVMQRKQGTTAEFTVAQRLGPNVTSTTLVNEFTPGETLEVVVRDYAVNGSGEIAGYSGDSNSITVSTRDGFTSASRAAAAEGRPFTFMVTTSQFSTRVTWSVSGLPNGLGFNTSTGEISGTPTESGVFQAQLQASFADGWIAHSVLNLRIAATTKTAPIATPTSRTVPLSTVSIPLSQIFRDDDTKQAARVATTLGNIDMVLYPDLTPLHVSNFMAYANAGDYSGSVFHRVSPGFVLQGGGYKFKEAPNSFNEVTKRPSPLNEPGVRNLQWTVAAAKGNDPNSASHDFFINLVDNSSLDTTNGGFTVFGRLADRVDVRNVVTGVTAKVGKKYKIKLYPSGGGDPVNDFDPLSGLGDNEYWPLNLDASAPDTIDTSKLISIQSVTPLPVLSYAIFTAPTSATATAVIEEGQLKITGVANGTTSLVLRATDVDGQDTDVTIPIIVDSAYAVPAITSQPTAVTTAVGTDAVFNVTATGTNVGYQWRRNGQPLVGQIAPQLTVVGVQQISEGSYDVVVSNAAGSVVSTAVALTVVTPVSITTPPQSITRSYGTSATFTVVAGGTAPQYQWRKGGEPIPGATAASYTRAELLMGDAGQYDVVVTNSLGNTLTSSAATLTVTQVDTDKDGIYDDVELQQSLLRLNPDTDGDGATDGVETLLGTNPRSPTSKPDAFLANRDGTASLRSISIKRFTGGSAVNPLTSNADAVPDQWLGTHELTNEQFAAVLYHAVHVMNVAEVIDQSGRRAVRYPKGTGEVICFLKDSSVTPPSCAIREGLLGSNFIVAKTDLRLPVRSVSWYAGYLASVVMNHQHGFANKTNSAAWSYQLGENGWMMPTFSAWTWAGQGGAAARVYPTGASITPAQAKLADFSATATPRIVGSYPASPLGYYDLAGNIAEWVADGDASNSYTRGGGYSDPTSYAANANYQTVAKNTLSPSIGIRLALIEGQGPIITTQPVAMQFLKTREALQLTVTAHGPSPLTYQWLKNGRAVTGKTSATLSIPSAALTDAGAYTVRVTAQGSSVVSSVANVVVVEVPATPYPAVFLAPNRATSFAVKSGVPAGVTLLYTWSRALAGNLVNDYTTHGVDKALLRIISAQQGMSGAYSCEVRIAGQPGLAPISVSHSLVVYDLPSITPPTRLPFALVGVPYSYQVPFSSDDDKRISSWVITGLPPGLTYDAKTGIISGTPTSGATNNVRITVSNPFGSVSESVALSVRPLPAYTASAYQGPVPRSALLNADLGGRMDFTVTATGGYTGRVILGAESFSFSGKLLGTVNAETGAVGTTLSSTTTISRGSARSALRLQLNVTPNIDGYSATLAELPAAASPLAMTGWRSICDLDVSATTAGRKGLHTFALLPPAVNTDATLVPQGASIGSVSVADNGVTTLSGRMADGSVTTTSGLLGPEQILMWMPLYGNMGSVVGSVRIKQDLDHTMRIAATESVSWKKKDLGSTSTERGYRSGFDVTLRMLSGAKHSVPASGSILMGLSTATADNARLLMTSGGLVANLDSTCRVLTTHLGSFASNPHSMTLRMTPGTGLFTGVFTVTAGESRTVTYHGIVVPDPTDAAKKVGVGFFMLPSTPLSSTTSPIYSGRVDLTPL